MAGHFDNKMIEAVNAAVKKAISLPNENGPGFATSGAFYNIFTKHDFYDVADTSNNLTEEQRAQVPEHARYRYSQFSNAIAEMLQYFFTDDDVGILLQLDNIILKLDANCTMNRDSVASVTQSLQIAAASNPTMALLGTAGSIKQVKEYLTGFAMGVTPFDLDVVSPFPSGLGLPSVNVGILGNLMPKAFFQPKWDIIYDFETVKSSSFYETGSGGLKIGAGIDLSEYNEINLKKIFSVVTAQEKSKKSPAGSVSGNMYGGIKGKDFEIIKKASKITDLGIVRVKERSDKGKPTKYYNDDSKYKDIRKFNLTDDQMRNSFYSLVDFKFWKVIKNPSNWAHGHWGALSNNALPDFVRDAVASFAWSSGLALEPGKSDEAALISYLFTIGLYYYIGWQYPVKLMVIPGVDRGLVVVNGKNVLREPDGTPLTSDDIIVGLPKDDKLAKQYWIWTADFIARFTRGTAGEELGLQMRRRRVAEANLIYRGYGKDEIPFPTAEKTVPIIPSYHREEKLIQRDFDKLLDVLYKPTKFFRYKNTDSPGGNPNLGTVEPQAQLLFNRQSDKDKLIAITNEGAGDGVITTIRHLLDQAFVTSATVTRTATDAENQARIMYENVNSRNIIRYKTAGRSVLNVYYAEKQRLGITGSVPSSQRDGIIAKMAEQIDNIGKENVSRHCADFNTTAVIDIGPNSVKFKKGIFKASGGKSAQDIGHGHLINVFHKASNPNYGDPLLSRFLFPHKYAVYALQTSTDDPAYHIEIAPPAVFETSSNDALPDEAFTFTNESFKTVEGREAAFLGDSVMVSKTISNA